MAIITISRGSASGGLFLAQGLSEKLGYALVSREDVIQAAARQGVSGDKEINCDWHPDYCHADNWEDSC